MYYVFVQDASWCTAPKNRGITLLKRQRLTRPTPTGMLNNFEQPKHETVPARDWIVKELHHFAIVL